MIFTPENLTSLPNDSVFVFGSNLAGSHGAGAAKVAVEHFGAKYGVGVGHVGQSFAIPTKDFRPSPSSNLPDKRVLTLPEIKIYVDLFIAYAKVNSIFKFYVTKIGCGLAGYDVIDIAPLFKGAELVTNIILPEEFFIVLTSKS